MEKIAFKVAVILVNYNNIDCCKCCIESLRNSTYKNYFILLVDNASVDGSVNYIRINYPEIVVFDENVNHGFGVANNIAVEYAIAHGAEYVLLLNNDTEVDSEMLERLILQIEPNQITVPKICYFDKPDYIWYGGGEIVKWKGMPRHWGEGKVDNGNYDKIKRVSMASGCCMLIPADVIRRIGLFDENYFMYFEDVDFCLRAKLEGIEIWYVPTAKLLHKVGASSGSGTSRFVVYYSSRNQLYFVYKFKNYFGFLGRVYVWCFLVLRYLKGVLFNTNSRVVRKAIYDFRQKKMKQCCDLILKSEC